MATSVFWYGMAVRGYQSRHEGSGMAGHSEESYFGIEVSYRVGDANIVSLFNLVWISAIDRF